MSTVQTKKNLSLEEKTQNLKSLIASQLQLRTVADVGDLEDAIRGGSAEITKSTEKTTYHKSKSGEEFSVGDFTDNFYPG